MGVSEPLTLGVHLPVAGGSFSISPMVVACCEKIQRSTAFGLLFLIFLYANLVMCRRDDGELNACRLTLGQS